MRISDWSSDVCSSDLPVGDEFLGKLLPREQFRVDTDDQHLLVIGPVENADTPAFRQVPHAAPQEVVIQLLMGGSLEGVDLTALRIDARDRQSKRLNSSH